MNLSLQGLHSDSGSTTSLHKIGVAGPPGTSSIESLLASGVWLLPVHAVPAPHHPEMLAGEPCEGLTPGPIQTPAIGTPGIASSSRG